MMMYLFLYKKIVWQFQNQFNVLFSAVDQNHLLDPYIGIETPSTFVASPFASPVHQT